MTKKLPHSPKFQWSDLSWENIFTSKSWYDPTDPVYQKRMKSKDEAFAIMVVVFVIFGLLVALFSDLFL